MPPKEDSNNKGSLDQKFRLIADSIRAYPAQLKKAWGDISLMYLPDDYKNVDNVILCGMGGSALGARMIDSLIQDRLRIPFEIYTEYNIPNYVNAKSLAIISSYSGTTEETLNCFYQAINKGAKIFGLTTGNKLGEILIENKIPGYLFDPLNNPSNQPRMALGYSSGSILALLAKLGFINVLQEELDDALETMYELLGEIHEDVNEKNPAKNLALKISGYSPVLVSSEHLLGTSHAIKNQFNENAKTFAYLFDLPELNHHLMEGLQHPKKLKDYLKFIFIQSDLYSAKVKVRYKITQEVVEKNGYETLIYTPNSDKKLSQIYELLIFGSYVNYFLTKLYKIDPIEIPWVDYFKDKPNSHSQ